MQFLRSHHVAVICSDYERLKVFYGRILGLVAVALDYRAARKSYKWDLRLPDGVQLELLAFPEPPVGHSSTSAAATLPARERLRASSFASRSSSESVGGQP